MPAFDNSDLIEKFKLTLIGRMFHSDGRSVEALLKHMPKRRIWDVEGRVRGKNLGDNKFQFDFDNEEDMMKVLQRRPCHFNRWSFSLEKWIPTIKEEFPNTLLLWASVEGIPIHYRKQETYESVGKALGGYDMTDVEGGRVRVFINGDLPLKVECKVGFDNGDVVKVAIKYEDLHRYCFTCKRISHEEGTCPELNEEQREHNRILRIEEKAKEEKATQEVFSQPQRRNAGHSNATTHRDGRGSESRRDFQSPSARYGERSSERVHSQDLRKKLTERREVQTKNVWRRLENNTQAELPRDRERYHPYQRSSRGEYNGKVRDTASSSEWRRKDYRDYQERTHERRGHYTSRYEDAKGKWGERAGKYSPRRQSPSDSQRTISDNFHSKGPRPYNIQRRSGSPNSSKMEWRPVSSPKRTEENSEIQKQGNGEERQKLPLEQSRERNSTASPAQKDDHHGNQEKGLGSNSGAEKERNQTKEAMVTESSSKMQGDTTGKEIPMGKAGECHQTSLEIPQTRAELEALEKEREDAELDKIIEEYAEMAMQTEPLMDADMLEEDDLLDELSDPDDKEGQIEAISQLSPVRATRPIGTEKTKQSQATLGKGTKMEPANMENNEKREIKNPIPMGRRRGARSPEIKGASASKKLATRGRLSPKPKQLKFTREEIIPTRATTKLPRHEVYPSAMKSRKPVSNAGSMVSQKPSSKRI